MAIVKLVSTLERIKRDFPDQYRGSRTNIMSADYTIDPAKCETKLGRWLAERIPTTRHDDDASNCTIIYPATEAGIRLTDMGKYWITERIIRNKQDWERVRDTILKSIETLNNHIKVYGNALFLYRAASFAWPVYGSRAAEGAETPEQYFDICARQMRQAGGVVLSAGLSRDALPDSLAESMAHRNGGGRRLIENYHQQIEQKEMDTAPEEEEQDEPYLMGADAAKTSNGLEYTFGDILVVYRAETFYVYEEGTRDPILTTQNATEVEEHIQDAKNERNRANEY